MTIGAINPDLDTIPGDKAGDDVVGGGTDKNLIILVIVFAIIFVYASKWWKV